jgi:Protein of unknown function (DUF2817)
MPRAVNPYGFAHVRRVTHENVDLNRNFISFTQPLPANADYLEVDDLLMPGQWPPTPAIEVQLQARLGTWGPRRAQMAITKGQHSHPDGMFFGGIGPTWSNTTFRRVLREHAGRCTRLAWLDLHSGLGPSGVGERIFACRDIATALPRARAWWGPGLTSVELGDSTSIPMTGPIQDAVQGECPQAEYTGICLEFGTLPLPEMMMALRGEHWLHRHPEAPAALAAQIRQNLRAAFYVDTDAWKQQVFAQGLECTQQALAGLRSER